MAYTKECFAILVTCLTQWWAPTVVRVSGDSSMVGQLIKKKDGSLECRFQERMVLMANHQLYTDWLYLWWIAYTNNMHGFVYIILKESLKNIPIIGWGAQFYNFIFLARNWEKDQQQFKKHLSLLNDPKKPMWLIIFPEGTNLSQSTREKSAAWAKKTGLKDMKHQLLPRSTGLRFCLQELEDTTQWLYDCTIAYEGVPPGQFGQDIFTLRSSFFEGRPPKSVNMHWRRFHVSDIPLKNSKAFEVWLRNRWREKDYMLEYFQRNNRFPAEDFWKDHLNMDDRSSGSQTLRSVPRPAVQIETEVKSGNWNEFVKIFAPITSVMMALTVAYGASPADLLPGGSKMFEQQLQNFLQGGKMEGLPSPDELEKMIEGAAKMAATQSAKKPEDVGKVQKLTQENLAQLVKETAIKNGMVIPGSYRRVSTAIPAPPTKFAQQMAKKNTPKAKSAINAPQATKKPTGPPKAKSTIQPKPASKPTPTPDMQTVMTSSGVMIKIPKPQVEEAKKTGTIVTKSGLVIRVGKAEIEEAQKKKGATIMTAGGVPIKITPSGAITVDEKAAQQQVTKKAASTVSKAARPNAVKPAPKITPQVQKPAAVKTVPAKKPTIPQTTVKKTPVVNNAAKKPTNAPVKKVVPAKAAPKKLG